MKEQCDQAKSFWKLWIGRLCRKCSRFHLTGDEIGILKDHKDNFEDVSLDPYTTLNCFQETCFQSTASQISTSWSMKHLHHPLTTLTVKNTLLWSTQAPCCRHCKSHRILRVPQNTLQMGRDARGGHVHYEYQEEVPARDRTKKDSALGVPVQD